MKQYIIISGIPGCGKTTLGFKLSSALGIPMLDKDDILEAMFDSLGTGDSVWRERLSRSSDEVLQKLVSKLDKAIVTSWWQHPKAIDKSGSSTDWVSSLDGEIIEIYCNCSASEAMKRFQSRKRHKGHLDKTRGQNDLLPKFKLYSTYGPLEIGKVIQVDTTQKVDINKVLQELCH